MASIVALFERTEDGASCPSKSDAGSPIWKLQVNVSLALQLMTEHALANAPLGPRIYETAQTVPLVPHLVQYGLALTSLDTMKLPDCLAKQENVLQALLALVRLDQRFIAQLVSRKTRMLEVLDKLYVYWICSRLSV